MAKQGNTINISTPEQASPSSAASWPSTRAGQEGRHRAAVNPAHAVRPRLRSCAATRHACARSSPAGELSRDRPGRCATTSRPTRSRRCRRWCTSTPRSAAFAYTGFTAGGEQPIGRAMRCAGRHRGRRGRQALRQGHVARAQPARREGGRRPPGDRRELRAHLPPERRQRRPVHLDRPRPGRAHRARRGDRARRAAAPAATRWPRPSCAPAGCWLRPGRRLRAVAAATHADRRRRRCSRRSSPATAGTPPRRRSRRPATAASCAPTGASSTSTTPACARTCSTQHVRPGHRLHDPPTIVCFEDHLSYVHRSPVHVAQRPGRPACAACRQAPPRLRRRARPAVDARLLQARVGAGDGKQRSQGISHAMMAEHYALPGPGGRGHRLAHAAQRRARLRGLRRRHDRHGQCLRHRRGAPDGARSAARRVSTAAARRRDRQGPGAAPAGPAGDPRRRRRRQGVRVRRRRQCAPCRSTSAPRSPT